MAIARTLLYFLGGVLLIGGIVLLFVETGLADWVPGGVALAGLIILIGLLVMGMADHTTEERHVIHEHADDEVVVRRR